MASPEQILGYNSQSSFNPCRIFSKNYSGGLKAGHWLILILVLLATFPAFAWDKVRVATSSPSVGSFPYFLAHKKGFYRSEGLDAEIIFVRANIAIEAPREMQCHFACSNGR